MISKTTSKLSLFLLLSLHIPSLLSHGNDTIAHDRAGIGMAPKSVSFSGTIIGKMDGIPGILDAMAMSDCFTIIQEIIVLIHGNLDPVTGKHRGIFEFEGTYYTAKEMVMWEIQLHKNNISKDAPEYQKFTCALKELKRLFLLKANPLIQKTKNPATRSLNEKLVAYWISNSGRSNSIIGSFGTETEMAGVHTASAREFFLFLNDLKCFLKDLMHSAPKACELYKKECLKPENYQTLDNFLNH